MPIHVLRWRRSEWRRYPWPETHMRPALIVVRYPRGNDELEMTLIERNQKVQTLAAQAPAKGLAHRIRFRRPHWRSQYSHTHPRYLFVKFW
jgi:hypothetical protein